MKDNEKIIGCGGLITNDFTNTSISIISVIAIILWESIHEYIKKVYDEYAN